MTDQQLTATLVAELHGIRVALEAMAMANPAEPRMIKPLAQYADFDWSSINALVVGRDKSGPTIVEWGGFQWKRRARDEYGADIFFTRPNGKGPDGKVRYIRLITFKGDMGKVKPVPDATREAMANVMTGINEALDRASKPSAKAPAPAGPAWPAEGEQVKAAMYPVAGEKLVRQPAKPAQPPAKPTQPTRRVWPGDMIQLVIRSGIVTTGQQAADLLNKSQLSPKDAEGVLINWLGKYRTALGDGQSPEQALFLADTAVPGRNGNGGANGSR